ncbi:MAG: hypothetical protein AAGI90_02045 [Chlamydiota bacterium]
MPITHYLKLGVFFLLPFFSVTCELKEKNLTIPFVTQFLRENGSFLADNKQVEFVERGMTHIYKVHNTQTWYLKFTPQKRRSVGVFYPKRLWSPTTHESSLHGIRRREALRPLIRKINALSGRHLLIPPHPIDQEGKIWELMTPGPEELSCPVLANNLATGWLGIEAVANPQHDGSPDLWDPKIYPASNLRALAMHLKKISDLAIATMDDTSLSTLRHERDRYLQYDNLIVPFLSVWGVSQFSLQDVLEGMDNPYSQEWQELTSQARKKIEQIDHRLADIRKIHHLDEKTSLESIKNDFYKKVEPIFLQQEKSDNFDYLPPRLRFFYALFSLEREGLISEETRLLGRNLAQCDIAYQLANDILYNQGVITKALFELLHNIQSYYKTVQRAPKSLIHGNAHPHEFLQDKKGNWTLGGCEYLHVGCVYRDIAQEYVRKLVKSYLLQETSQDDTLEKIEAVLVPGWFDSFWPDIMGYCVVEFAQELETLFFAYSMDLEKIDFLNLTITPETFLKEMRERLTFENCYRNELFPLINPTPMR